MLPTIQAVKMDHEGRTIVAKLLISLVSWVKKSKACTCVFKIVEKAYDSVIWDFIDSIFQQMRFLALWRKWIRRILKSSRASVLINGSPTLEFQCYQLSRSRTRCAQRRNELGSAHIRQSAT